VKKVLDDQTARENVKNKVPEDLNKPKVDENLPKMLEGNKNLASIPHSVRRVPRRLYKAEW